MPVYNSNYKSNKKKNARLNCYLDDDLNTRFENLCVKTGMTKGSFVSLALGFLLDVIEQGDNQSVSRLALHLDDKTVFSVSKSFYNDPLDQDLRDQMVEDELGLDCTACRKEAKKIKEKFE